MATIGISLIFLTAIGVIVILTFIIPAFTAIRKKEKTKTPGKISYVILGLLVVHWLFFLTDGYALLPMNIADAIFIPVWLILCTAGVVVAVYEFKNNRSFAIFVVGLTTISLLFSILAIGIGNM